jgi:hypothetical protein
MSWNYRIVKKAIPAEHRAGGEFHHALHEVYYDKEGRPNGLTQAPAHFGGADRDEIANALELALRDARERPILNEWDIRGLEHTAPGKENA